MILSRITERKDLEELIEEMGDGDFFILSLTDKEGDEKGQAPHRHALFVSCRMLEELSASDGLHLARSPACGWWGRDYIGVVPSRKGLAFSNEAYNDEAILIKTFGLRSKTFCGKDQMGIIKQLKEMTAFIRDERVRAYRASEILNMDE